MARSDHTAWTPTSVPDSIVLLSGHNSATRLTAETVPGIKLEKCNILLRLHINTGGGSFELEHPGDGACGIPEAGDTMVLTGGAYHAYHIMDLTGGYPTHNYVTRWVDGKIIIIIMFNDSDDDHDFDNDNENEYFSIND